MILNGIEKPAPDWVSVPNEKIETLSDEDQIRKIASWEMEDLPKVREILDSLIKNKRKSPELRATALRAALRMGCEEFTDIAEKMLKAPETPLVISALQYLGHFDPEKVFPFIGQFLRMPNKRVKAVTLKILKKFDVSQALSFINTMLENTERTSHEIAISCMLHFDFPLVRDQLTQFLLKHPDTPVLEQALCFFQANPEIENLYCLYKIEKKFPPEKSEFVKKVRVECQNLLKELGHIKPELFENVETELQEKWEKENAKERVPKPAYAYKPVPKPLSASTEPVASVISENFFSRKFLVVTGIAIGIIAFLFLVFSSESAFISGTSKQSSEIPPRKFEGLVESFDKKTGAVTVRDFKGEKIVFFPKAEGFFEPKVGEGVKGTIVPFSANAKGIVRGRLKSLEKK